MAPQREWFEKNYYEILGVSATAAPKEITKAYRQLARENHPDANPGNAAAEERFKEISAAYDVLGDAEKRKEYDQVRTMGPMGGGFGPGGFQGDVNLGDLGDLFGGLFNRGGPARGRARGGRAPGSGPRKGEDLVTELHLAFVDAAHGIETSVHLTSDAACSRCDGSGAEPGTSPRTCNVCSGRGVTDDNQGFFSFSSPCNACTGRGYLLDSPCTSCRGAGVEKRPREIKVRIPAGVSDGQRIRLKGRGAPGRNGAEPGDLFVVCRVAEHELFGRKGDDLTLSVPITFAEAALGADIAVPTLDGEPVKIRIPAGTHSGRTFRIRGRGIEAKREGDLLVTVEVAVPVNLSKDERKAVEALAAATTTSPRAHLGV